MGSVPTNAEEIVNAMRSQIDMLREEKHLDTVSSYSMEADDLGELVRALTYAQVFILGSVAAVEGSWRGNYRIVQNLKALQRELTNVMSGVPSPALEVAPGRVEKFKTASPLNYAMRMNSAAYSIMLGNSRPRYKTEARKQVAGFVTQGGYAISHESIKAWEAELKSDPSREVWIEGTRRFLQLADIAFADDGRTSEQRMLAVIERELSRLSALAAQQVEAIEKAPRKRARR